MLKQQLTQKLQQKLSPQQIQLMKLLQIPTAILDQRIQEEIEANPALEEGDNTEDDYLDVGRTAEESKSEDSQNDQDNDLESDELPPEEEIPLEDFFNDYSDDDEATYKYYTDYGQEEEGKAQPIAVEDTFHEYLEQQMGMLDFKEEREEMIARQIIGSIDDDGYLRRETEAILDDLIFSQNIVATPEEIEFLLSKIQRFDPPGVGARSLQESLLLQIENKLSKEETTYEEKLVLNISKKIIAQYFDEFAKKHYHRLQRQLGLSDEEELKEAIDEILKLNPKPASGYVSNSKYTHYIVPDFIIINNDGELELSLNSRNAPDLHINNHYKEMLRSYKHTVKGRRATKQEKDAILFIKQKIDSAKWFIDAIRQRQQTMFNTMYAIMNYQYDYFVTGDQKRLRPMILKDIADITSLDISTVSRVANSKFVQTEFGTKRLKDFFSESLQTQDGEEVSTLEVKKILTDIIGGENKRKPFSDEKLKNLLLKKGYNIARRTVAKYREQLNIPVARLRKEL